MTFAPKDLCERLVALGCMSQSGHIYPGDPVKRAWGPRAGIVCQKNDLPAFSLCDFVGTTDQARENRKITGVDQHAMIDAPDWVLYLRETMR